MTKKDSRKKVVKTAKTAKTKTHKYVYSFGGNNSEGNVKMKALLGGKGANLADMQAWDCLSLLDLL